MKQITKQAEPTHFVQWKTSHPGAVYADLSGSVKSILKQSLITEQHGLCCYCEKRIDASSSHIEHFKPKGILVDGTAPYAHLQLDYTNLHASCLREPDGDPEMHCGHKKGSEFSAQLLSPLSAGCENHFKFTLDGKIVGITPEGLETIRILHLDSSLLDAARKFLIDYFENDVEDADLEAEVMSHLDTNRTQYGEYFSMIQYLWNNRLI